MQNYEDVCEYSLEHFYAKKNYPRGTELCRYNYEKHNKGELDAITVEEKIAACEFGNLNGSGSCSDCFDKGTCTQDMQELWNFMKTNQVEDDDRISVDNIIDKWQKACYYGAEIARKKYEDHIGAPQYD